MRPRLIDYTIEHRAIHRNTARTDETSHTRPTRGFSQLLRRRDVDGVRGLAPIGLTQPGSHMKNDFAILGRRRKTSGL